MICYKKSFLLQWILLSLLGAANIAHSETAASNCSAIKHDGERLACYDSRAKLAEKALAKEAPVTTMSAPLSTEEATNENIPQIAQLTAQQDGRAISKKTIPESSLSRAWELNAESKSGTFNISTYHPTYFLFAQYSSDINKSPSSPAPNHNLPGGTSLDLMSSEAKFQISGKTKVWENIANQDVDLWVAYTQQSSWQVYNSRRSAPFRETNYEPEIILSIPTRWELFGLNWRMLNLGFVHKSNGRPLPQSRSWNRAYAQFGLEKDNFTLLVRPWLRTPERDGDDDNPDISKYMGNGDVRAIYKVGKNVFSALGRYSFSGKKGALELDWAFPISGALKGYMRAFNGYGESLIDYNHKQTTLGAGVTLSTW